MFKEIALINYPVDDLPKAKAWYSKMFGIEPYLDMPVYVGFKVGTLLIGLNPNGKNEDMAGPVPFWKVDDVQDAYKALLASGASPSREPQQLGSQILASVVGVDGNLVGVIQFL